MKRVMLSSVDLGCRTHRNAVGGNASDIREDDRRETYYRLNSVEQRVSKLEAQPRI
jgi:hypothetical protein